MQNNQSHFLIFLHCSFLKNLPSYYRILCFLLSFPTPSFQPVLKYGLSYRLSENAEYPLNALTVMAIIWIVFASSWELLRIAFVASSPFMTDICTGLSLCEACLFSLMLERNSSEDSNPFLALFLAAISLYSFRYEKESPIICRKGIS